MGSDAVLRLHLGQADGEPVELIATANMLTGDLTLDLVHLPKLSALLHWLSGLGETLPPAATDGGELVGDVLGDFLDVSVADAVVALRPFPPGQEADGEDGSLEHDDHADDEDREGREEDEEETANERAFVQAIGFAVAPEKAIEIVPGLCRFQPAARIRIDHPFLPSRVVVGLLEGTLVLGAGEDKVLQVEASLWLPSGRFEADATLSLKKAWDALGGDVDCPQALQDKEITLTVMGDALAKSVSAELRLGKDESWAPAEAGNAIELREIVFMLTHEAEDEDAGSDARTTFQVGGTLAMPHDDGTETKFDVFGGYDDGWYVFGDMEGKINLSAAAGKLAGGAPTPETKHSLELADVAIRANFTAQEYSFHGRTEGRWEPFEDVDLTFEFERVCFNSSRDGTATEILCHTKLGRLDLRLLAKRSASDGGWTFVGSTLHSIDIGEFAHDLDSCLKINSGAEVPPGFRVTKVQVRFETKTKLFQFDLDGEIESEDATITGSLKIEAGGGDTGATTVTGGLDIGDVHVKGRFHSKDKMRLFAGSLLLEGQTRRFDLQRSVKAILGERGALIPALQLEIDSLVFAWKSGSQERDADAAGFLIDLALGLEFELDLRDALPIGGALGVPRIALEDVEARYASVPFEQSTIETIRTVLDEDAAKHLEGQTISAGLGVAGTAKLGNDKTIPLALAPPPEPAGDAPSEPRAKRSDTPDAATEGSAKWVEIRKALGPLYVGRIGFDWRDGQLGLLLDSSIDLAGLKLGLSGLAIHFPLKMPPQPSLSLNGMDLSYSGGPVSITGAFLRSERTQPETGAVLTSYDGMALVKAADFTIGGFGSITGVDQKPSVFVYAALLAELGGPPAFRVRGIAGGFGYNRTLTLPLIEDVRDFPLVQAALNPDYFSGADGPDVVDKAMNALVDYIAPSGGDYWLAAGVRFNSFELVEAFVLLSVSFGHEVEIGVLGLGALSVPRGATKRDRLAYAELALRASIKPEDGTVFVEGRLTKASYILSKDCRLTGGFAFFFWSSGNHAGDFVITLGGYHPRFVRPRHYPVVPRLGIHWQVTSELLVTSEMYFALTPACLMAGGKLSAVYRSGRIRAWFIAYADFLLNWEPLHYTADLGVSIGVDVNLALFHVRVSLRVDLHLWGPPFGGTIHVDLDVISFSIPFGEKRAPPEPIKAPGFRAAFLPDPERVVTVRVGAGLMREQTMERPAEASGETTLRVVNAHHLILTVQSLIPVEEIDAFEAVPQPAERFAEGADSTREAIPGGSRLGIAPMGRARLGSSMTVTLCRIAREREESVSADRLVMTPEEQTVPAALWKATNKVAVPRSPPDSDAMTLPATTGLSIAVRPGMPEGALAQMPLKRFDYADLQDLHLPEIASAVPPNLPSELRDATGAESVTDIIGDAMTPDVVRRRHAILSALADFMPFELNDVDLAQLTDEPETYFQADPVAPCALGSIGEGIVA